MRTISLFATCALMATTVGVITSQPPSGGGKGKGAKGAIELGRVIPPAARTELKLTRAQEVEIDVLEKGVKARLEKLLTAEQRKAFAELAARGPGAKGGPVELGPDPAAGTKTGPRLLARGALKVVGDAKFPFTVQGDASAGILGDSRLEHNGGGVRLLSGEDVNNDGKSAGEATCRLTGVKDEKGRWYRVRVNALAQDEFAVGRGELFLKVEFFKDGGTNSLDFIKKSIYEQVEFEREALFDSGTNKNLGRATWRNYSLDVRTPFPEVDTLQVTVGFANGTGKGAKSEFRVAEVEVTPIPDPADYAAPAGPAEGKNPAALKGLVKLGGRWYFDPRGGDKTPPKQFDHTNVDRLYYLSDRLESPFVGNVSAWLRKGYQDRAGNAVGEDVFVDDAVTVAFTDKHLVMRSKNLPNHPVSVFPDRARVLDGNPNVIREQRDTWYIPLEPKANPNRAAAITMQNQRGLPMGPIGVAVNGVVFFNPFDEPGDDAVWRLDRCCGHPSPFSQYHYHKYPVCVNTPWADDGTGHSPLIGFAFDGFPVYGPYEARGVLAKDAKDNPLNEFNIHTDDARGPHYHVTPGKFPHLLGGYWGVVEPLNRGKKGPPKK